MKTIPKLILQIRGSGVSQVVRWEFAHAPDGRFIKKQVLLGSLTEMYYNKYWESNRLSMYVSQKLLFKS